MPLQFWDAFIATDIFEIASKISTPLGLAGFIAAALFLIFRAVVKRDIFPRLNQAFGAKILLRIITFLFVLALVAIVLGCIAFVVSLFAENHRAPDSVKVSLTSDMTFRQAAETIAGNDSATVTFPDCDETALNAKIRGGELRADSSLMILETLKYRFLNPASAVKYQVEYLKDRGIYEIHCSH